ncbi:RNA polymerase sigma factor [Neptunicoccus cionae]|uniref:RNA polymerase subunit sigma-24 n=1 Tax=Neptunicoccus cionae TaxID=2035344 RepID=A0A916QTR8_9RHOB|nr:RNA polymerase sigma factor [Amylibacter cionae]GGA10318.1 RNA polymerase subunit sigma-24 [Amylibacter cionae]
MVHAVLSEVVQDSRGRLLAALIANLRDFQLAEDSMQDALASALVHWRRSGIPANPTGWLLQTARRKAIDRLRMSRNFDNKSAQYAHLLKLDQADAEEESEQEIPDERLRLIFTCCHPALDPKTRIALTLRTLGGLTTAEIARAFLDREPAMAQRLVRARHKIAKSGVPFRIPEGDQWAERLNSVLSVIYLIFNEGYAATKGDRQIRVDLCEEAIFLAQLIAELRADQPEVDGLLALMLMIHARRHARATPDGALIPIEDQDRTAWDQPMIAQGIKLIETSLLRGSLGPYQLQAAIQAVHSEALHFHTTRWHEILGLYDLLVQFDGSAIVKLNRCVALSYVDGPEAALQSSQDLDVELAEYQPYHAARAAFYHRAKRHSLAVQSYDRAIDLCDNNSATAFLVEKRRDAKKEAEQMLGL